MIKNGGPGRPSVHIPPEVQEELRGLSFTWQKIVSIFRVAHWTIMRRVHFFGLEHLSLFSSIKRAQLVSYKGKTLNWALYILTCRQLTKFTDEGSHTVTQARYHVTSATI